MPMFALTRRCSHRASVQDDPCETAGLRRSMTAFTMRLGNPAIRLCAVLAVANLLPAETRAVERLGYHEVRTDPRGRIVPWYGTGRPRLTIT